MNNLTLAITTIGDLLLRNKISRNKNGKPIDNICLSRGRHKKYIFPLFT